MKTFENTPAADVATTMMPAKRNLPQSDVDDCSEPVRTLPLAPQQAASWLRFLEALESSGMAPPSLVRFRERLNDACWLGRWVRGETNLELSARDLAGILEDLQAIADDGPRAAHQEACDNMLQVLSAA